MSVVNTRLGFVYLALPHTASRCAVEGLLALDGSRHVGAHHCDLQFTYLECPEASRCQRIFTTVRHPFDWLVSRFLCNGGSRGSWDKWLKKWPPGQMFSRFEHQITVYAKYENLQSDLNRWAGEPVTLKYEREYKTAGKPKDWRSYWTDPEIIELGREKCSHEMGLYNYEF